MFAPEKEGRMEDQSATHSWGKGSGDWICAFIPKLISKEGRQLGGD